ncbi:rhodanese-like domain-containing protein [Cupriavidus basilensis]
MTASAEQFPLITSQAVRQALLDRKEIALVDVREEDPFAQSHPLCGRPIFRRFWKLELDAWPRIPAALTRLYVVYGEHGGCRPRAAGSGSMLRKLGYTVVDLLDGGSLMRGSPPAAGVFRDVNVPSKSFGEVVEAKRHTPVPGCAGESRR